MALRKENMPKSIIIGAGWAGLSCAYYLARAGHQVQVLEAAPQIGGRARSIHFEHHVVDNGQHIAVGAYLQIRTLIAELGLDEQQLFHRLPFELITLGKQDLHLRTINLPTPFNFLFGIACYSRLPWRYKIQLAYFATRICAQRFKVAQTCTVLELLQNYHQSCEVIEHVWEPIALAAMTTPIDRGCGQIFLNILRQTFTQRAQNSHWYLPKLDLSSVLPIHLANYLHANKQKINCSIRINYIKSENNLVTEIGNAQNNWTADHIVLATPFCQTLNLIAGQQRLLDSHMMLSKLSYEPITTVYFKFAQPINLPYPILGLIDASCEWIFDRAFVGQPQIMSIIISGKSPLLLLERKLLLQQLLTDIRKHFATIPDPIASKIICEKRAAFSCTVDVQKYRPSPQTALRNLWLCGDYLQTGLPASLEGAVLSGKQTADAILGK